MIKSWIYQLPHELPNYLQKLGNFKKIPEIPEKLGNDGKYPVSQISAVVRENGEKPAIKYSKEALI